MIPNSAIITVGEPLNTLKDATAGKKPSAEYAILREGHFDKVLAMAETSYEPGSFTSTMRFALHAYRDTWDTENIHLGEEFPGIQYLAIHALARRQKRISMLIHNITSLRRRLPLGYLRMGRTVDHLLCLSEQSREELVQCYHIDPSKITVIGSRVDTQFFSPNHDIETQQRVCSAGAVNRDYPLLISAMEPLGVTTKIAADTEWRYSAKDSSGGYTSQKALPDFVEMRSWETYRKLRDLYASSAVIVVPLKMPMLSGVTVALEGMAMGKPVILTYNPYVEDFLIDGETGFFVPQGNVEALRARIRQLLDNPELAERIGARARDWVCEKFTVQRYVDRILSVWN